MQLRPAENPRRPVPGVAPDPKLEPMRTVPWRVVGTRRENADTFTIELAPPAGVAAKPFKPGQFNMLYVFGVGEVPISISGDPDHGETLHHTTREVGAVTREMGKLRPGDAIGVRGPFGTSWPVEAAEGRDLVIVAGGIGLPPLCPALHYVMGRRERYGRVVLLYGARNPDELLFQDRVETWRAEAGLEVMVTVDRATGTWAGNVGVVTPLVQQVGIDPSRTTAMICGPEIMFCFACEEFARCGVNPQDTFVSLERNMKCAVGLCGHCQVGPYLVCRDGPVFPYDQVQHLLARGEV